MSDHVNDCVRLCVICVQVAGETEVKGQIKLRFLTSTGQPVVVVRSFQVLPCMCDLV